MNVLHGPTAQHEWKPPTATGVGRQVEPTTTFRLRRRRPAEADDVGEDFVLRFFAIELQEVLLTEPLLPIVRMAERALRDLDEEDGRPAPESTAGQPLLPHFRSQVNR